MKFSVQFDYHGRHRIVMDDGVGGVHYGEWAGFRSLATFTAQGKTYIAATSYGLLPQSETVYELSAPLPTTLDKSMEYIDAQGKDRQAEVEGVAPSPTNGQGDGFTTHGLTFDQYRKSGGLAG